MTHPPTLTQPPQGRSRPPRRRRSRTKGWVIGVVGTACLGVAAWQVMAYYEIPPFTDKGDSISFAKSGRGDGTQAADSKAQMATGPEAAFEISGHADDGSKISVTTLKGKKSGFTGKVWVWAPKEYFDEPKYKNSGFPVLIALPGGSGYPNNYFGFDNGTIKLESSIAKWVKEGKSLPFILAMPVLNPEDTDKKGSPHPGRYWDGSDIPGQPKMGTWLTEDVPDLIKANFRTIKARDGWGFMGNSTGGFAGLKSVLQKPDKFKAVIANGPDIVPDSLLWDGHDKEKAANNPRVLAPKLIERGGPDVYLGFQIGDGKGEANDKKQIDSFISQYGKGPVKTKLHVIKGGQHNGATYLPNMDTGGMIQWISQHMQGPVD
ncbi:alpha/beta hydrolase [Streptomyces violascens]|uniref:alpha/beta hydrolase n=1 Tax=Streptomyces violascens TaxID=67381 RepID=UPI00367CB036